MQNLQFRYTKTNKLLVHQAEQYSHWFSSVFILLLATAISSLLRRSSRLDMDTFSSSLFRRSSSSDIEVSSFFTMISWTISLTGWNWKANYVKDSLIDYSNLQRVKEVGNHLQDRRENHSDGETDHQYDYCVERIIFFSPCSNCPWQELMSSNNVRSWIYKYFSN